jgi:hypothetical protein
MRLVSLYRFQYPQWVGPVNIGVLLLKAYYENNRSVIATQRVFRTRFALGRNAHVAFSFGGYLKEKVFKHRPRSLEDLKETFQQEIDSIPPELTRRVMKNFRERLQQCLATDGRHMPDIIFKPQLKKHFYVLFNNIFNVF